MDIETEYRLSESVKKSMVGDLAAGQRDLLNRMNRPDFVGLRSEGTFRVLSEAELAERRGDY